MLLRCYQACHVQTEAFLTAAHCFYFIASLLLTTNKINPIRPSNRILDQSESFYLLPIDDSCSIRPSPAKITKSNVMVCVASQLLPPGINTACTCCMAHPTRPFAPQLKPIPETSESSIAALRQELLEWKIKFGSFLSFSDHLCLAFSVPLKPLKKQYALPPMRSYCANRE